MKIKSKWEKIEDDTRRLKVVGGWIVCMYPPYESTPVTSVFISDPKWEWEIA